MARLFDFPDPVNDVAARTVATGVVALSLGAIGTGRGWLIIPLAYGFVARVASGPRFSPLGLIATRLVAPRLTGRGRLLPGPPKRFAQGIGATFALAALGCWLAGARTGWIALLAVLVVPATLEATLGYCVGCTVFAWGMRRGLLPEATCLSCADLRGPRAVARRT